ncbi:MAG: M23 family metallopeptidase [Anaerolineaceae bacterium]|jgi:hypothetical protein
MIDQSNSPINSSGSPDPTPEKETPAGTENRSPAEKMWHRLVHLGLGETALRIGTGVVSLLLVIVVVWVMNSFVLENQALPTDEPASTPSGLEGAGGPLIQVDTETINDEILYSGFTVSRLAQVHTDRPAGPRTEIVEYTIQSGDTLFGIAEKYGLKPQTLLWSNRHILGDDPHNIFPGVSILIPTMDGAIYFWNQGDGLNGVSSFYKVTPDDIIDWPANNLDRATLGDLSLPNITPGTMLFVPGGEGDFTDWLPHYSRDQPAESSIPGGCGIITEGFIGNGTFIWPTTETYLSGYDYTPETNHRAIDIAGHIGNPIWAVDAGVIVYSGWNDRGYGNLIVVDHGNGWQSVYAHLDTFLAFCGQSVDQGDQIGTLGTTGNSTGPHLHFELRHETYGVVNPWDFLQ